MVKAGTRDGSFASPLPWDFVIPRESRRATIIHATPVAWARDPQQLPLSALLNYKGITTVCDR